MFKVGADYGQDNQHSFPSRGKDSSLHHYILISSEAHQIKKGHCFFIFI
jgi:hypothetical protein